MNEPDEAFVPISSVRYSNHTGTNGFSGMKELFKGKPRLPKSLRNSIDKTNKQK